MGRQYAISGNISTGSVGKSPRPVLSSHCGRQLQMLLVGIRDSRKQRWAVALTMAMLPHTGIDTSATFGAAFLPLLGEPDR
jgi:hypothetical protein